MLILGLFSKEKNKVETRNSDKVFKRIPCRKDLATNYWIWNKVLGHNVDRKDFLFAYFVKLILDGNIEISDEKVDDNNIDRIIFKNIPEDQTTRWLYDMLLDMEGGDGSLREKEIKEYNLLHLDYIDEMIDKLINSTPEQIKKPEYTEDKEDVKKYCDEVKGFYNYIKGFEHAMQTDFNEFTTWSDYIVYSYIYGLQDLVINTYNSTKFQNFKTLDKRVQQIKLVKQVFDTMYNIYDEMKAKGVQVEIGNQRRR